MSTFAKGWIACVSATILLLGFILWPRPSRLIHEPSHQTAGENRLRQLGVQFDNFSAQGARTRYPGSMEELRTFAIEQDANQAALFEETANPVIYRKPTTDGADEIIFYLRDPVPAGYPKAPNSGEARAPMYIVYYAKSGLKRLSEMPPIPLAN